MLLSIDQQAALDAIFEWHKDWTATRQYFTLGGFAGCLSGDTIVRYRRGKRPCTRPLPLREFYKKFNGLPCHDPWLVPCRTYLQSMRDNGTVFANGVLAVVESGVKNVVRLDFSDGNHLVLTEDHPIATPGGVFVEAGRLSPGSSVLAKGSMRPVVLGRRPIKDRPPRVIVSVKYHPYGGRKIVTCNGIQYEYTRVARARLVVEAHMNGVAYDTYVRCLKKDPLSLSRFVFLPPELEVHHKDENTLNDTLGNLQPLTRADHSREHSSSESFPKEYLREVSVTGIKSSGREMTYDIQMMDPAHNFAANDIFVHNTGKTTIIRQLLQMWQHVAVVAPTGKAVNRLKQTGVRKPTTIHALAYIPYDDEEGKTKFKRKESIKDVQTIICDEASMVNEWIFNDILSYCKPVVFVGDHGQLEPIGPNPHLMLNPDARLEKIHRQAEDNPILRLASAWREGREAQVWAAIEQKGRWSDPDGKCVVTSRRDFDGYARSDMQLICGYNKTRHRLNNLARNHRDFGGPIPQQGEKLICLKNNKEFGIYNGQQATVLNAWKPGKRAVDLELELDDGQVVEVPCLLRQFGQNTIEKHKDQDIALFDFAYCITAHKSQGSEWPAVCVLEEISSSWNPQRWRYTVTTRAKEQLVYCV